MSFDLTAVPGPADHSYPDSEVNPYPLLLRQAQALLDDCSDLIAQMANISALLYHGLPDLNWVGFYRRQGPAEQPVLVLGPFQGKVACVEIPWGKGVCGTAAATNSTQRVADVHAFAGHIACDAASESEIVIPVRLNGQVIAVLDIDSPIKDRFTAQDQQGLEQLVALLEARQNAV